MKVFPQTSYLEGSINIGKNQFADAVSWSRHHSFGKKGKFKIGYGVRLTNYFSSDQPYITAPAKFTSGKESIIALFTDNIMSNLDTVNFGNNQVNSLNSVIYITYSLNKKIDIGMNIDAVGFSFGKSQNGFFLSNGIAASVSAKPTGFNILLISDSDQGSLNSEWYLRYWFSKKWAIKVGYEFMFTEYTTGNKIQKIGNDNNDRFRNKSRMFMIGVTYSLKKK